MNQTNYKYGFPLSLGFVGGQLGCHRIDASSVKKNQNLGNYACQIRDPSFHHFILHSFVFQKKTTIYFILTTTFSKTIYFLV